MHRTNSGIRLLFFLSGCVYSLETSVTHRRADIIDTVNLATVKWTKSGPGSSVGIATAYGPDGPGIESRWG